MIFGLSTSAFTTLHVLISLIGILGGVGVFVSILQNRWIAFLNQLFIVATIATSVTGFLFPSTTFGPPHVIGVVSLIVLVFATFALAVKHLLGGWLRVYIISALLALYLNAFVGVVQAFQKIPALRLLAPTQQEAPFVMTQLGLLILFVIVGVRAVKCFRLQSLNIGRSGPHRNAAAIEQR
jgi:hypothetical protein